MRSLNELYIMLLEKFPKSRYRFICNCIKHDCCFTKEEVDVILEHFKGQRPTKDLHKSYYDNSLYNKHGLSWFVADGRGRDMRIRFLKKLVKLTSS